MTSIEASWSIDKKIPSELDAGHAVIEELMKALETLGWEGRDVFHVQMAIEEAVVNAIEHGNKRDDSKQVHVVFRVNRERAELAVTDQGQGFDHRNVADPTEDDRVDVQRFWKRSLDAKTPITTGRIGHEHRLFGLSTKNSRNGAMH